MTRLLLAALVLAACPQSGTAQETVPAPDLSEMDWQLAEVDGAAPGWAATLHLGEPGRISGQAPCNRYAGALTHEGARFEITDLASTKMACLHLEGEAEFFALLGAVTTAEQAPGLLLLSGGGHEMRFVRPID